MKEGYQITKKDGILNIVCPIQDIISLRQELFEVFRGEIMDEFRERTENGYEHGVIKQIAEKYHCSSNNITSILQRNGIEIKRKVVFN